MEKASIRAAMKSERAVVHLRAAQTCRETSSTVGLADGIETLLRRRMMTMVAGMIAAGKIIIGTMILDGRHQLAEGPAHRTSGWVEASRSNGKSNQKMCFAEKSPEDVLCQLSALTSSSETWS